MASLGNQLSFFLLLVLFLSPQIQARESKFFSFFSHFKTTHNVEDPQLPAPTLAPTPAPTPAPAPAPTLGQEPASAPEIGTTIIPSGPAPEPEFLVEKEGHGYGLYGIDSSQYSSTKETPKTITDFENELLNEDFNDNKSYKKGYPQTNLHNNNEVYTKNYNNEEYKNNYNNNNNNEVYTKNYNGEEYKNNYNNNNEMYTKNYNNNEEYKNNYGNGYERKREGMSDTRFMENGKYSYNVDSENENYSKENGYESGRGSTENEGNYEKNQYPNEFETMEEYERQQESQGYTYKP
jgi:hypothetical protein